MVHARQLEEKAAAFGNAGALYMNAMTWWDHETRSIWTQPLGEAIAGPLQGTRLELLPAQVVAWENWLASYPETFVLTNDLDRVGYPHDFRGGFVIGIAVGDQARAFEFIAVTRQGVINDFVGDLPVAVWAQSQEYRAYFRRLEDRVLTFDVKDGDLVDRETGSRWDARLGLALEGALAGETLQAAPSITAYDWAWADFYPDTEIVRR